MRDTMNLTLVKLNTEQIQKAKTVHGPRKQITHALICGNYGQLFATEKYCRKYLSTWKDILPSLFEQSVETEKFDFQDYHSTFNLVIKLIEASDNREKTVPLKTQAEVERKGVFARLFGI